MIIEELRELGQKTTRAEFDCECVEPQGHLSFSLARRSVPGALEDCLLKRLFLTKG